MKQLKLYFKGFNRLFGRAPKSSLQKQLEAVETIRKGRPKRLSAVFGDVIDMGLLRKKPGERNRALTRVTVFCAALQEIQQARMEEGFDALSASTSSYCTAKKERMDEADLKAILVKLGKDLADQKMMALGIHSVSRLHQGRKVDLPEGVNDKVVEWTRPVLSRCLDYISRDEWQQMPQKLHVRYIHLCLQQQGFRPEHIIIATTFLDEPAVQIAALFLRRWRMEMCFADLKTTLGMDNLMFQSPEMARSTLS